MLHCLLLFHKWRWTVGTGQTLPGTWWSFDFHRLNVQLVQQLKGCNSRKKNNGNDINVGRIGLHGSCCTVMYKRGNLVWSL